MARSSKHRPIRFIFFADKRIRPVLEDSWELFYSLGETLLDFVLDPEAYEEPRVLAEEPGSESGWMGEVVIAWWWLYAGYAFVRSVIRVAMGRK
jgi:hypothetical protein